MTTSTNLVDYIGKGTLAARPASPTLNTSTFGLYYSTDVAQVSLWNGSAWVENVTGGSGGGGTTVINGLISGGQVVWETGLQFRVSAATYYINSVLYTSPETTITLDAADGSNPRIDVIVVNTSSVAAKVTGTAAAAPSEPDVDPGTQLKLKFVLVPTSGTAPSGVSTEDVYLEDAEWTASVSGSGFNKASTSNPYAGTKDIEGTTVTSGSYVQLQRSSSTTLDSVSTLNMFIRSKAAWNSGRGLRAQFFLNGVAKGTAVTIASGYWGFDSSTTSGYQFVAIPLSSFVLPAGTTVNQLRITDFGGSIGFYIDNITLTTNGTSVGGGASDGITQADADARYAQRANNLSDLNSASTARTNLGVAYATAGEINTGTEAGKVISPDTLAGSNFGKRIVTILVSDPNGSAITTGDGKAYYRVPSTLNGMNLVAVAAAVTTVSSSGIPTVQIANVTDAVDMLSTKLTIDANETDSSTAATAAVIDAAHDDVATGDMLRIDLDVAGTGAKGLIVEMQFQLP